MVERFGPGLTPGTGWRASEIQNVARAATERAEQGGSGEALSDRVLDAIGLLGTVAGCRERIAAYREAGLDLPILWPGVGVESAREVIAAFSC